MVEPMVHNEINNERPDTRFQLEYVYGYRSADAKKNLFFNVRGDAVYNAAALGVILDYNYNT